MQLKSHLKIFETYRKFVKWKYSSQVFISDK